MEFNLLGVDAFTKALDGMVARAEAATKMAVADGAHMLQAEGMSEAPVLTGNLRRSFKVDGPHREGFGTYTASVGPTAVYARRIELGYQGPDSLGRVYDQQPDPYFGTAAERVFPQLGEIHAAAWAKAIHGG